MPFSVTQIFKNPSTNVFLHEKTKPTAVTIQNIIIKPLQKILLTGLALIIFFTAVRVEAKPPILLSKNSHWWQTKYQPKPKQGWDTFTVNIKKYHPYVNQQVEEHGSIMLLINMRVTKKGRVDFAEIWDSNTADSLLKDTILQAIKYNSFTPYQSHKGKQLIENTLVLMEIPAEFDQLITQPQDTTIPNKSITPARFLGGDAAFRDYIANEFVYPSRCLDKNIAGYVRMRFMVNRNGVVTQCRIKEGTKNCPEFGLEAARILKACPKWVPATYNGKNISAWFEVPISLSVSN